MGKETEQGNKGGKAQALSRIKLLNWAEQLRAGTGCLMVTCPTERQDMLKVTRKGFQMLAN